MSVPINDPQAALRRRLAALVRLLPKITARGATFGERHDPGAPGQMPYFHFNQLGKRFWNACCKHGWVLRDFDWMQWGEGQRYLTDFAALARAPLVDLERLLTVHLRSERLGDGHLQAVLQSGHLAVLLGRLRELLKELPPAPASYVTLARDATGYPAPVRTRLAEDAPATLWALGNLDLLALPKTALFASARCPGDVLLRAYDQAAQRRDTGRCVVSGFHAPLEQECLRILLRGTQPIIICPARGLPQRLPAAWRAPLAAGRLLLLSCFPATTTRTTAALAARRNLLVAALADDCHFAYVTPDGKLAQLAQLAAAWPRPAASATPPNPRGGP